MGKKLGHWPGSARLCDFSRVIAPSGPESAGLICKELVQRVGISDSGRQAKPGHIACSLPPAPRCCHAHDCCYQKLFDLGCHPYVDHYEHTIENNTEVVCSEFSPCHSLLPNLGEGLRLPVPPPTTLCAQLPGNRQGAQLNWSLR